MINAETAYYVCGAGEITSPAGDDLPAFKSKADADAFAKKYDGQRVMPFDKVSNALIKLLNGRI